MKRKKEECKRVSDLLSNLTKINDFVCNEKVFLRFFFFFRCQQKKYAKLNREKTFTCVWNYRRRHVLKCKVCAWITAYFGKKTSLLQNKHNSLVNLQNCRNIHNILAKLDTLPCQRVTEFVRIRICAVGKWVS